MKYLVFIIFCLSYGVNAIPQEYVVVVSLDGFRADYPEKYQAKNILKLAKGGVRVKRMIASNPTKTFPNHYTLATGLYPENHGLVGNSFYAPQLDRKYRLGDRTAVEDGRFYGGEPIWNTARKSGMKTASFYWVGSEAKVQDMQPNFWKRYNSKISFPERIDTVVSWLRLPESQRPRLVMLYYEEPDHVGHIYGPNSVEVAEQVRYVDEQVGDLYEKLMQLPIADKINLIVLSDHGMREISQKKQIVLEDYIKKEWVAGVYGSNPVYSIRAKQGFADSIYKAVRKVRHLCVFKYGKIPKRFHFGKHPNFGDFVFVAKSGWSLFATHDIQQNFYGKGTHGYLNTDKQMSALFVAKGSAFKENYSKHCIKNVDVYVLLAHILGISPAPNDGKFRRVKSLLK